MPRSSNIRLDLRTKRFNGQMAALGDGSGRAVLLRWSLVQTGIIRFLLWTSLLFQGWAFWARMRWGTAKGNDDTVEGCLVVFSERVEKWHDGG